MENLVMGMTATVKIAIELYKQGLFKGINNVMDMGSQELHIGYDTFKFWCQAANLQFNEKDFEHLKNFPGRPRVSTAKLWNLLGVTSTACMDINRDHNSIFHDLNYPFTDEKHINKYDLVTDFGNNEHPFNVVEAYKTMHKLCKKNGYLWIDQAVLNGNGFFNFDISFFECMATANRYGIIYSAYVVNTLDNLQFHIPCHNSLLRLFDLNSVKYLGISYIFKKSSDEDFKYFYQDLGPSMKRSYYEVSFIPDPYPPERYYIPTLNQTNKRLLRQLAKNILQKFKFL